MEKSERLEIGSGVQRVDCFDVCVLHNVNAATSRPVHDAVSHWLAQWHGGIF